MPKISKKISTLIDNEISALDAASLDHHLRQCQNCREFFDRVTLVNEELRAIHIPEPHPGLAEQIKSQIFGKKKSFRDGWGLPVWGRIPLFAVILLLAIGLGNIAGKSMLDIIAERHADNGLELMAPEIDNGFAEAILNMGNRENSR